MHWQRSLRALIACLAVAGTSAAALSIGCTDGRFPVCHSDADCNKGDAGTTSHICYNLRCVECHYDTDCAAGKVCSSTGACQSIGTQAGASEPPKPDDPGASDTPQTWDECAKQCKDQPCLSQCDARFHPK